MNRNEKLERYKYLYFKDAYWRTSEDAEEIRRLSRELFQNKGLVDLNEKGNFPRDYRSVNENSQSSPHNEFNILKIIENKPSLKKSVEKRKVQYGEPLSQVKDADHWSRLLGYYTECLVREHRQQYVIKNWRDTVFRLELDRAQAYDFIQSKIKLEYSSSSRTSETPIEKFFGAGYKRRSIDQQFCFGYPMFVVDGNKVAPLIIAPLNLVTDTDKFRLEAEDFEISYAALECLGLQEEEIAMVLDCCAEIVPDPGQSYITTLESELVRQISDLIGYPLRLEPYDDKLTPGQLYDIAGLFRVKPNIATVNLIKELRQLSDPTVWDRSPLALRELLSVTPERKYPKARPIHEDNEIYVTVVNNQQRRAISSALADRITVVTGPPGTGKSQLVLNVVAQALVKNQTVLFASRNNQAVDVVMNRLQNDINFPGSVRTGNKANREKAALQMRAALGQAVQTSAVKKSENFYQAYKETKDDILEQEVDLHNVRDLIGLISSYDQEWDDVSRLLPQEVVESYSWEREEVRDDEVSHLLNLLANFRLQALNIKEKENLTLNAITEEIIENPNNYPLITSIRQFETQRGPFGGRLLNPRKFDTLQDIQSYLTIWETALPAFEIREQVIKLRNEGQHFYQHYEDCSGNISDVRKAEIEVISDKYQIEEIQEKYLTAKRIEDRAKVLVDGMLQFWERLLAWLRLRDPVKRLEEEVSNFIASMGLNPDHWNFHNPAEISAVHQASLELCNLLKAAKYVQLIQFNKTQTDDLNMNFRSLVEKLPKPLAEDISRIELDLGVTVSLYEPINKISIELVELITSQEQLVAQINKKVFLNDEDLDLLRSIMDRSQDSRKEHQNLNTPISQNYLIDFINYWRNLIQLWKIKSGRRILRSRLDELPGESELIDQIGQLQNEMLGKGAEIIHEKWLDSIHSLGSEEIQKVYDYISAVEQLCGPYNENSYPDLKDAEVRNFPSALKVFPIWATTNLAAKTNLLLTPELFDLVVIDEASQCDIPSALPLLYRAKHILIIGDPNQLRHVATLYQNSDLEAANKYSINIEAYLYNTHSLFDLAQRSVGSSPGTLLLNEHYRSDYRIIEFSNQEFYGNQLVVRTDLKRRGIPISYLKQACGVYWLHSKGATIRPPNGSAYNPIELELIKSLIPKIKRTMKEHGMFGASLGIVTPYREQEQRLYDLISDDQVTTIGTAHKFQGDECDLIIFSPVLSSGISDGSLHWLNKTVNLLNVSVTRPRCTLIIVGNWEFCQNLSPDSKYHKLAQYAYDQKSVYQEIDELPLLNSVPIDLIGEITDPTNREFNRITIRKFLSSCDEYIWWMDRFFNDSVFDLILDVVQQSDFNVQDIRLLTSLEQIESLDKRKPEINLNMAQTITRELGRMGIQFSFGSLTKKELPHDRFLYSHHQAINMPPFSGAYGDHQMLSEYTRTSTGRDFFEQFWNEADKLEQRSLI